MLRLLGFFIKLSLFATIVLVLGNIVPWNGRTVSDEIKYQIAQAERPRGVIGRAKSWSRDLLDRTSKDVKKRLGSHNDKLRPTEEVSVAPDEIPASERQKLRALIRELNGPGTN